MLLFFCCSAPSFNRYHIFETPIWVYYHGQHTCGAIFHVILGGFFFFFFLQCVQPDSWSSLCDTGDSAQLHWLQPSGYLTQPLATQWLTQRLIGVLKASYLTHQNNKYCYQAGSSHAHFCTAQECLLSPHSCLLAASICLCSPRMLLMQPWHARCLAQALSAHVRSL